MERDAGRIFVEWNWDETGEDFIRDSRGFEVEGNLYPEPLAALIGERMPYAEQRISPNMITT